MTTTTTVRAFRRIAAAAGTLAAATALALAMTAQPAAAANATQTGMHTVCATSLTVYYNGPVESLHSGEHFDIDHFAGEGHVWGWAIPSDGGWRTWGWVYNGWFC